MKEVVVEINDPKILKIENDLSDEMCEVIGKHIKIYEKEFGSSKNELIIMDGVITKAIAKLFMGFRDHSCLQYAQTVPLYVKHFLNGHK